MSTRVAIAICVSACWASVARADYYPIDLTNFVNTDLTTYSGGSSYPQHGGGLTLDTIPFELATIGGDTGMIQSYTDQGFTIPVDVFGVTTAYLLVNSAFGTCGSDIGQIEFIGSSQTFTYALIEGTNVRDHYNGNYCNSAPGVAGTATFGNDRLDMQEVTLPQGFSTDTLQSIVFQGFGQRDLGLPFLTAATVVTEDVWDPPEDWDPATDPVPEPSSFFLACIAGTMVICASIASKRRRR